MGDVTKIEWTDRTFNPWVGCARVSPGCRFCYADEQTKRWNPGNDQWRRHGTRRVTSDANWRKPYQWNRAAEAEGVRARVFCSSLADVFEDHPGVSGARERLWKVIGDTPWLTWQLLTKRPENVARMVPWGDEWPENVWLGASAENRRYLRERSDILLGLPAKVRFLSCEPLLEEISLRVTLLVGCALDPPDGIGWVIVGGESGRKARPMRLDWVRSIVAQCAEAGVPCFVKQAGTVLARELGLPGKGGDPLGWPEDIRVRQFPADRSPAAAVP